MDSEGRVGWIPEIYLQAVTATPSNWGERNNKA
jgi:hypothetical protein